MGLSFWSVTISVSFSQSGCLSVSNINCSMSGLPLVSSLDDFVHNELHNSDDESSCNTSECEGGRGGGDMEGERGRVGREKEGGGGRERGRGWGMKGGGRRESVCEKRGRVKGVSERFKNAWVSPTSEIIESP